MNKQSLSKNLIFQFLYQGLILIIPLILSPYLTRTLHETAIGIYSYTNSIAYYFVLVANLGISRHGQRIISQNSGNQNDLRRKFWSLFVVHIIISAIVAGLYIFFVVLFVKEYKIIYLIQTFYVMSALFDITWLFYGLENFKSVVIKNAVVKIAEGVLVFIFVKCPADLWKYTTIATLGLLIGQVVMLPQAINQVKPIRFDYNDAKEHVKPLLFFSISMIAVTLYTVFDKTLLGLLTNKENVAFYEYSNRIITIPKTIIGVIGTVMFPRACRLAAKGDLEGQKRYMDYSVLLTSIIGIGSVMGLISIGKQFALIYFGDAFAICGKVIIALSPLIYIIGIGDIIRTQYMIPNHMDKHFNLCILLNAIVNIILSTSLIPVFGIFGAVIGTVSAEVFGFIYQLIVCRRFIKVSSIIKTAVPSVLIGSIMLIVIKYIQHKISYGIISLIVSVFIGALVYSGLTLCYIKLKRKDLWENAVFGRTRY